MSDLEEALISPGLDVSVRSLKIWLALIINLMLSDVMEELVSSTKYEISIIFKKDFD